MRVTYLRFSFMGGLLIAILSFLSSCQTDLEEENDVFTYIHMGHPRSNDSINQHVRPEAAAIDYRSYDVTMLGGDMLYWALKDSTALNHLDFVFDIKAPTTLWALGNHDNGNGIAAYNRLDLLEAYTKRKDFYTTTIHNITYLVLNTQHSYDIDSGNNFIGDQLALIQAVADTITQSDALIVLAHKLVWVYDKGKYEERLYEVLQVGAGNHISNVNPSNFYEDVYPLLVKVKKRGIEVICVGGDIGNNSKAEDFTTADGVHLLASGIGMAEQHQLQLDQVLIFKHSKTTGVITWNHVLLSSLIQ